MKTKKTKDYQNFDSRTGKKINPTCPYCWILKEENHNCGYEKCPGYDLPRLWTQADNDQKKDGEELTTGKATINEIRINNKLEPLMNEDADKKFIVQNHWKGVKRMCEKSIAQKTMEEQLLYLAERSRQCNDCHLAELTQEMINIAKYLEPRELDPWKRR